MSRAIYIEYTPGWGYTNIADNLRNSLQMAFKNTGIIRQKAK